MTSATKPRKKYYCARCGSPFHYQVHRAWLIKQLAFIIPVKKYFCAKCKKSRYVLIKNHNV